MSHDMHMPSRYFYGAPAEASLALAWRSLNLVAELIVDYSIGALQLHCLWR